MTNDFQQNIYQEMMSHPALFTHPHPQTVAVISEQSTSITEEVLKHPVITEVWQSTPSSTKDPRIKLLSIKDSLPETFDVIILATENPPHALANYHQLLRNEGILLCQSTSPFEPNKIQSQYQQLKAQGFYDIQILNFPQPNDPTGWRSALISTKSTAFKRVREKDIFNRPFTTKYYNFDVHKASLALPEFMREGLPI